jgi:glycosyltransferase involved in cell wall biosynthesis
MPNVLVIAYYFPPMGGAGVQRTLKFVKYLPDFGWQPHVLTVRKTTGLQDPYLVEEIPTEVSITRTAILQPPSYLPWKIRSFISRWFLIIDEEIGWLPLATPAARGVIESANGIQMIYSTSAPYTSHLVARRLHWQTQLPWVADFRDPWMGNPFIKFPTTFHRRINEQMEQSVFTGADRVIFTTDAARMHYLHKYATLPAEKLVTIPNGYDPEDLPKAIQDLKPETIFNIVHLGSLYQKTRSSESFLRALHQVFRDGNLPPDKIRVQFIGNIDKETQGLVNQFKLNDNVMLLGYLTHRKAIDHLFSADLLLLIPSYGTGSELFVPAKLYEYLASQKPILCLAQDGPCAQMIIQRRAGWIVPPQDSSKIAEQLVRLYRQWENGALRIDPEVSLISSFERRKLTGKLASIFDELSKRSDD